MNLKKMVWTTITVMAVLIFTLSINAAEIHKAAKEGDFETVKKLLAQDPKLVDSVNQLEQTPLSIASYMGHEKIVRLLLDKGADIKKVDRFGSTALHMASLAGKDKIVALLLDKGADMTARAYNGKIPMQLAFEGDHTNVVEVLIKQGVDIQKPIDQLNRTLLHKAATMGKIKVAGLLLEKGLKIDAKDKLERTALDLALICGHRDFAEFLKSKGAKSVSPQEIQVIYLANEGFVVTAGSQKILIDGLFNDGWKYYMTPPVEVIKAFQQPDHPVSGSKFILVTHNHQDHFDLGMVETYMNRNSNVIFISPRQINLEMELSALTWEKIKHRTVSISPEPNTAAKLTIKDLKMNVLRLNHGESITENVGYVVNMDNRVICHLGDALLRDNMNALRRYGLNEMGIDVVFLQYHNLLNADSRELIKPLINPKNIVVMHIPPAEADNIQKEIEGLKKEFPNVFIFNKALEQKTFK
jgi:ankyrin repeat protein